MLLKKLALTLFLAATASAWTDDPLTPGMPVRAAHVEELRAAINSKRLAVGLSAFPWTDPVLVPNATATRAVHIQELRTALGQIYAAVGQPAPSWTDALAAQATPIRAVHMAELRRSLDLAPAAPPASPPPASPPVAGDPGGDSDPGDGGVAYGGPPTDIGETPPPPFIDPPPPDPMVTLSWGDWLVIQVPQSWLDSIPPGSFGVPTAGTPGIVVVENHLYSDNPQFPGGDGGPSPAPSDPAGGGSDGDGNGGGGFSK